MTAIIPNVGLTTGGETVIINGTNFTGATQVSIGGQFATSFNVLSATQISAVTAARSTAGLGDVVVSTPDGVGTKTNSYVYIAATPTVTAVSPNSGPITGATSVTITGTNLTGATAVTFGGTAATLFAVNSATSITALTPAHASGAVDVAVTSPGGTGTGTGLFTYSTPAPTVTSITPTSGTGAGGTSVTINGTNLSGATAVKFGFASAQITLKTATQIFVQSPPGAGIVDVTVTTPAGTSATSAADRFTYLPANPTFSSVNPSSGTTAGGTSVTITGTNFTGFATTVTFGGTAATGVTVVSSTLITVTTPAHAVGAVDIVVSTTSGVGTGTGLFTYAAPPPAPTVTSVSPPSGSTAGGATLTITGTNLSGATGVTMGGVAATGLTNNTATSITVTTPAGSAGTASVLVTTAAGTNAANTLYTYVAPTPAPTVASVSPPTGTAAGGATLTITGTDLSGATGVTIGGNAATGLTNNTATSITVTTPAGVAGTASVLVTTAGGTNAANTLYTYVASSTPAPTVTSVSPATGSTAGGTSVTITGTNLSGATDVTIGGAAATGLTNNTATSITVTTPAGAVGTASVLVTTPGGTNAANTLYTYIASSTPAPTVTSVSPATGSTAGGTSVTITGTNLSGATGVTIGGVAATGLTANTATSITVTTPAGSAGTASVLVTTAGGTNAANTLYTYTAPSTPAPTVTSVSPSSGPSAGGTTVTITGANLTGATAVKFGSTNATSFTVVSATSITAVSPAGTGAVDVTVTTPGGTSAASAGDKFTYGPPADSLKVRALQNSLSPMVAQTSGQVITTAIDGAISDAFSSGDLPLIGGPNGATFNFFAEPDNNANDPIAAELARRRAFLAGTPFAPGPETAQRDTGPRDSSRPMAFSGEPQGGRRIDEAFSALAYAANVNKAPSRKPEREWRLWLDVRGTGFTVSNPNADLKGSQLNLTLGLSRKLNPDTVVGVIAGYENFNYDVASLTGNFKGSGETVGGYFARRFGAVRFDAALAWSNVNYNASAGTASGSFTGSRWLASLGLTGTQKFGLFLFEPSAKVFALWERQTAWTDSLGTMQDARNFSAGRASAGSKVARLFALDSGGKLAPFVGLYGDYRFQSDNAVPAGQPVVGFSSGWSARVTSGLAYTNAAGGMVSLGGEVGGFGSNFMIYSGSIRGAVPF